MKIVVSVKDTSAISEVIEYNPTFIEVRLDRMDGDLLDQVRAIREETAIPLIATLRSREEGGNFVGDADLWARIIGPIARYVDFVDVEARYRDHAPVIKSQGIQILASLHTSEMPTSPELGRIESMLRSYGDIPKIVVKPRTTDDLLALVAFTHHAQKPICTSVMGAEFRYARAILPLFGSEFMFCHAGTPTAEGQYHIREARQIADLLG
ncbi:MAG TPA: type I 3-dehydroquinate dehydratase [Candidatus Methanoculleus thermohydrogenotrophicum]|jgi:3-dehydroquinate dehydratase-1|nr:type I 3-dehydroquinate dehydratase [Candidatus Methanoculleus thermohydrogenotrophicum]NLM81810.1 type I 3-dehydroquinate dehydratase [Candidatus Methanoculleus thermohydrogenotrophicum]HOB17566.1 type I 3-dehydroquinate dehydratase [Candidatus Methanoculleus thermohydrogenotrophicum]HPZ37722.1 type I 3-dehydroquinate dehydratase [Candidatus Methanoculleus thermohydrogenotrophicum]HQC90825.1 type I 3-dehydroquinate dehydratase [Candidatus Methanoculleus thermohydrogenotrophicum]